MYDLIIVGAGPAGITAAIYAARKRMNLLVITKDLGGQAALSGDVENYTGYQYITGFELTEKFLEHMKKFNIELREAEEVRKVERIKNGFRVLTDMAGYETKSIILASGARPRTLNIPGENEYKNRGVTYCATCDAPLFLGKDVAVIGGGNSALDAALQLTKIANKIYLITKYSSYRGETVMLEKVETSGKVTILYNTVTLEILGDKTVNSIKVGRNGEQKTIDVQGVFIEVGYTPNSEFVQGFVNLNECGEVMIDSHNRTDVLGFFAAGDVTNVAEKQIIIAAGEGAKASLSAFEYLSHLNES
jgi:alkyl hydroperoxide reductase subunit F